MLQRIAAMQASCHVVSHMKSESYLKRSSLIMIRTGYQNCISTVEPSVTIQGCTKIGRVAIRVINGCGDFCYDNHNPKNAILVCST